MASMLYEGVLLFGVVMLVGLVYGLLTNQRHAMEGTVGLKVSLFCALGLYFVYFWSRQGQTLAMKTWHVRLVDRDNGPPALWRATLRYLFAWMWFLPSLAALKVAGWSSGGAVATVLVTGALAYAWLARVHSDRQFLHDVLCGTRLLDARPAPGAASPR
ncbi:MAG: RDD family protein [Rubrivivax sp.]|nr:RDD family protein [Rubrivivax sp.]